MKKMRILVTGSRGFVGKNLCRTLETIRDGKNRTWNIEIDEIFECDIDTPKELLEEFCSKADFVFSFAGVNRPKEQSEFMEGNRDFTAELLSVLKKLGLPSALDYDAKKIIEAVKHDKKLSGDKISVTYVENIGEFKLVTIPFSEFAERIGRAFEK